MTLTDADGNLVTSLSANATPGTGDSFLAANPTRIQLATSMQDALGQSISFDPATDIYNGNEIDMGAGSGLSNGDEVIYHVGDNGSGSANTAVGGSTDGAVYTVTLDPANPGYVTLTDANGHLVTSITGSSANGEQSFQPVNNVIALSEPSVAGPGHALTPTGGSPITFNPTTDLDATNGTIYVGPDSGLYAGEAVVYTKPVVRR